MYKDIKLKHIHSKNEFFKSMMTYDFPKLTAKNIMLDINVNKVWGDSALSQLIILSLSGPIF